MKVKSLIILIAVAIGIIAFCSRTKTTPTKNHLKVGAAIALTGFGSDFGQSENNAIKLLKEKYGPAGEVEFYIEDTRSDVRSGVTAIKKLIDINKCDIVYCELSSIVNAASSIIRKAEVTLIAPVYLDLEDNPFAVRNLPSADQENTALIDFLISNNVVHDKIAVLYSNDVFGRTCYDSFSKLLPENSTLCYSAAIDETALRETALKAIVAKPDVIYLGSMSETLGLLVKFLRQNGYNKEIITTDAFSYDYINSIAGEYAHGVHYVDFKDSEKYKTFRDDYNKRFGIKCVPSAMLCYDGVSAVISARKNGEALNGTTYDGLTGVIVIKDNEIIYPIEVVTWE